MTGWPERDKRTPSPKTGNCRPEMRVTHEFGALESAMKSVVWQTTNTASFVFKTGEGKPHALNLGAGAVSSGPDWQPILPE